MRYQLYREHKYVSAALNDVERMIAKTDFRQKEEAEEACKQFEEVALMLKHHAQYEDDEIHSLLSAKNSTVHEHAEDDHAAQDAQVEQVRMFFQQIDKAATDDEKIDLGYKLYLTYRKFVADNLIHMNEEETEILPELQRLYADEELRNISAKTYREITPDQMLSMMKGLSPYMNPVDHEAFLVDLRALEPEKFKQIEAQL